MAYIEKERIAEIRAELKKLFPTFKFSVTRQNYSEVNVKILAGTIDFFDDAMRPDGLDMYGDTKKLGSYAKERKHTSINEFYIAESWEGEAAKMLLKVKEIVCKGNYNRNAGDMGADYPDWNFFTRITIGSYDRPYQFIPGATKVA